LHTRPTNVAVMGAALVLRCSPHCCHQLGAECEEESIGLVGFESLSVLDWGQGLANGEPVGRILHETLSASEDSDLLCFAASGALTVVKWLLYLGAGADSSDANGTTVLHAACRSGSLAMVKLFIKQTALLNKPDVAGWTPLHIAAHMGRRAVVVRLLQAKATPGLVNSRGLKPVDLCKDTVTYQAIMRTVGQEADPKLFQRGTHNVMAMEGTGIESFPDEDGEESFDDLVGLPQQCEPELFFVNPRPVFSHTAPHRKALLALAAAVFNLQPSHGLAIMILTGLEEGYTSAMKVLLKQGHVSRTMAGNFLGEPLSVCPLIRFSFFDSLPLLNTGVISCLRTLFSALGIPEELQKLDRILWAVASVWWRKHRAMKEAGRVGPTKRNSKGPASELSGLELMQYLSGQEALYQLMLSTVLLHRRIWGGANNMPTGPMDLQEWTELNEGIERQGEDNVPFHVQQKLYNDITSLRVSELCIWQADQTVHASDNIPEEALPGPLGSAGQIADLVLQKAYAAGESALQHRALLEGWLWVHTSALLPGSLSSSECAHTSAQADEEAEVPEGTSHRIWGSLCSMCLVFSSQAPGVAVPHAIMDCRGLQFLDISDEARSITLAVKPIVPDGLTLRRMGEELLRAAKLLPDGRWEELCMQKLKLTFESAEILDLWVRAFMQKPCDAALPDHLQGGSVLRARADALSSAFKGEPVTSDETFPRAEPFFSQDKDEELQEASFVGIL